MSFPVHDRIRPEIHLAFDDVMIEPAPFSAPLKEAKTDSVFSTNITLHIPFVATGKHVDTEIAISCAQMGSIAILPHDMPISKQADMVRKVKRFQSRIVRKVISVTPEISIAEVMDYKIRYGLTTLPVVESGTNVLAGFLVLDDKVSFDDPEKTVSHFMSSDPVVTVPDGTSLDEAYALMQEKNVAYVAIVDDHARCIGLITQEDKEKAASFPFATVDDDGCLRVVASVGTGNEDYDRVSALMDAGVDAIFVETAQGYGKAALDMVTYIRRQRSARVDVIAGNIQTSDAAIALADAGANGIVVGSNGNNSVGIPQFGALLRIAEACSIHQVPVLATGNLSSTSELAKSFAAGAGSLVVQEITNDRNASDATVKSAVLALQQAMSLAGHTTLREFSMRTNFVRLTEAGSKEFR